MTALYEIAITGAPSGEQTEELAQNIARVVQGFGLALGHDIGWRVLPNAFDVPQARAAVVAFFGAAGTSDAGLDAILGTRTPILPIASRSDSVAEEIPASLRPLSALFYETHGPTRIATALLECLGLLPRQRRVFVSYRRDEARAAAVQLFNALSSRLFDVFLDTHGIPPAEDFQAILWHRLCDSDVLIMLDTPGYFERRWTSAEYGRALAKGISVLRIGWPNVTGSPRTSTASQCNLETDEVDERSGNLAEEAVSRICTQLEIVRSQSQAVRNLNLFSNLQQSVECIGGSITGVGLYNAVHVRLPDGQDVVVYPTANVPTSLTLHDAASRTPGRPVAVLYDHVGLKESYLEHLQWLGEHITVARWIRASEAAWDFAGWEV